MFLFVFLPFFITSEENEYNPDEEYNDYDDEMYRRRYYDDYRYYQDSYYYDDNHTREIVDLAVLSGATTESIDTMIDYIQLSKKIGAKLHQSEQNEHNILKNYKKSDDIGKEDLKQIARETFKKSDLNEEIEKKIYNANAKPTPPPQLRSTQSRLPSKNKSSSSSVSYARPKTYEDSDYMFEEYDYNKGMSYEESFFTLDFDDNLTKITNEYVRPVYRIESIDPISSAANAHELVFLKIYPKATGSCFCKFDNIIVSGIIQLNSTAMCRAPEHKPGLVAVFFSKDKEQWYGPIEFKYDFPNGFGSLKLFFPVLLAIFAISGLAVLIFYLSQLNCCKSKKKPAALSGKRSKRQMNQV